MRTTVDIPDELLRRAEAVAAQRGMTLRELVVKGLGWAIQEESDPGGENRKNRLALIAALSRVKLTEPIGKFNREDLYDRQ